MPKQKPTSTEPKSEPEGGAYEANPPSDVELPLSKFAEISTQMPLEILSVEIGGETFEVPSASSPKQPDDK